MNALQTVFSELAGLFVDDGMLAFLTLGLIAGVTGLVGLAGLPPLAGGLLLVAGAVAILAESLGRATSRR